MKVIFLCKSFPESLLLLNVLRQNIELQYPVADFTFDLLILDKTDPPLDTIFFQNSRWNTTYYASKVVFQKTAKKLRSLKMLLFFHHQLVADTVNDSQVVLFQNV